MNFKSMALVALLSAAGFAQAGTLGWSYNKDMTGKINLSDDTSQNCRELTRRNGGDHWGYAELVSLDGRVDSVGCWNRDEGTDVIRVRWSDGSEYTYQRGNFTDTPYFTNRNRAKLTRQ